MNALRPPDSTVCRRDGDSSSLHHSSFGVGTLPVNLPLAICANAQDHVSATAGNLILVVANVSSFFFGPICLEAGWWLNLRIEKIKRRHQHQEVLKLLVRTLENL